MTDKEKDIEFLHKMNKENKFKPPTENSEMAFVETVHMLTEDEQWKVSIDTIRSEVYSMYAWGQIGDMPQPME